MLLLYNKLIDVCVDWLTLEKEGVKEPTKSYKKLKLSMYVVSKFVLLCPNSERQDVYCWTQYHDMCVRASVRNKFPSTIFQQLLIAEWCFWVTTYSLITYVILWDSFVYQLDVKVLLYDDLVFFRLKEYTVESFNFEGANVRWLSAFCLFVGM